MIQLCFWEEKFGAGYSQSFNPFTPMSDQDGISPDIFNIILSRPVTRIKKNVS